MIFHPRRKIKRLLAQYELIKYEFIFKLFGFEKANLYLKNVSKTALKKILKKHKASIGKDCDIETGLTFHNCKDFSNLIVGNNCHIGKNCFFDLRDKVIIGNNVVISMQCTFITHIDMSKSPLTKLYPPQQAPIIIEDGCYLGVGTTVLKGVSIGRRSFVAARSLVLNNVEKLVGGVPAVTIKVLDNKKANL